MRNALIAAGAVAVAVVLFVVLRPNDDNEVTTTQATTTAPTTQSTPTVTTPVVPQPPQPPPPARVRITIKNGLPVGGPPRVTVAKGRRVVLVVSSDVADEVHVHGYDLMRDVAPGRPATIQFRATIVGTVEAELEGRGVQIATITTKP
ncbi:MAG TPA: hypothetical protein VIF36_04600 [Gaiellaceae bacterium]